MKKLLITLIAISALSSNANAMAYAAPIGMIGTPYGTLPGEPMNPRANIEMSKRTSIDDAIKATNMAPASGDVAGIFCRDVNFGDLCGQADMVR